jgi:hypothetical protein
MPKDVNADTDELDDKLEVDLEGDNDVDIEIEDDTPEQDRGREPMPKEIVDELEKDELEEYDDRAKQRLKQLKKVWHDERREKERKDREAQEALALAQRYFEENKRLREGVTRGNNALVETTKTAASLELEAAKKAYRVAYEEGDADKLLEAQERLTDAQLKVRAAENFRPALQTQESEVDEEEVVQPPKPDSKTVAWQERNTWFGSDTEMTAAALGLHQKLEREHGASYVGSDEYWQSIDKTMRRRFPEYFGDDTETKPKKPKSPTVVAPVTRSTAAKKVVLKASEIAIARKLGLTPEQYAREKIKTGA